MILRSEFVVNTNDIYYSQSTFDLPTTTENNLRNIQSEFDEVLPSNALRRLIEQQAIIFSVYL
jgi:hypothetical protein